MLSLNHCLHDHEHTPSYNWALAVAVGVNLLFTFLDVIFSFHAHSSSLLADEGHNLGDVLGLHWLENNQYAEINCALSKKFEINHVTIQVEQERLGGRDGHIRCGC